MPATVRPHSDAARPAVAAAASPYGLGLHDDRLRHGSARLGPRVQAPLRRVFDHAHVGKQRMIAQPLGCFEEHPLLDTGA